MASNVETLRRDNLSHILAHLHVHGRALRSDLAGVTGLRRNTIGQLVASLEERGLATNVQGKSAGQPGRPSHAVDVRWEGAVAIAIEIGVRTLAVGAVGLGGEMRFVERRPRAGGRMAVHETLEAVCELARPVIEAAKATGRVIGVGVSFFGVVDPGLGYVRHAPNIGWRDVDVREILRQGLGTFPEERIVLANDADCGAIAEHRRGAAVGVSDFVYLSGEVGIGGGIISRGELLTGLAYAGELGHMKVNPNGRLCNCGRRGCWETEIGGYAVLERAQMDPHEGRTSAHRQLLEAVEQGDPRAHAAALQAIHWLGLGIANILNILNPQQVVLGSGLGELYAYFEKDIMRDVRAEALGPMVDHVKVVRGALADASLLGAGELVLTRVVDDPTTIEAASAEAG